MSLQLSEESLCLSKESYIYIYSSVQLNPESGLIQSGQLNYSNFKYLNIPGKELNVTAITEQKYNNNNNNNNNNKKKKKKKKKKNSDNDNNKKSRHNELNCKSRNRCPMNGLCNSENVVYQGIIYPKENAKNTKTYIGIPSMKRKLRFNNHNHSFPNEHLKNQTALSKQFWILKNNGLNP